MLSKRVQVKWPLVPTRYSFDPFVLKEDYWSRNSYIAGKNLPKLKLLRRFVRHSV